MKDLSLVLAASTVISILTSNLPGSAGKLLLLGLGKEND